MNTNDDWRLTGQEHFLMGAKLVWRSYERRRPNWDHDHCEFCGVKFSDAGVGGSIDAGYTTLDDYRWICPTCFADFRERFQFEIANQPSRGT